MPSNDCAGVEPRCVASRLPTAAPATAPRLAKRIANANAMTVPRTTISIQTRYLVIAATSEQHQRMDASYFRTVGAHHMEHLSGRLLLRFPACKSQKVKD